MKMCSKKRKIGIVFLFLVFAFAVLAGFRTVKPITPIAEGNDKEARVTGVSYGVGGMNLLVFTVADTDYPIVNGDDSNTFNYAVSYEKLASIAFFDKITVDGKTLAEIYKGTDGNSTAYYINLFQQANTFALHLPGYTAQANLQEIVVMDGCQFPAYQEANGCYTVGGEVRFVKEDGMWTQKIDYVTNEVEVTALSYGGWDLNYLLITLEGTDYPDLYVEDPNLHNYKISESVLSSMDFFDKIRLDGMTLREIHNSHSGDTYRDYVLNFFQFPGTIGFVIPGYSATSVINEIVIEKGCQFPSYEYVKNGGQARCFETAEEVICVKGTDTNYTVFKGCDPSKPAILDDSITLERVEETYRFDVRFNRKGTLPSENYIEDEIAELVEINGVKLSEINAEKKQARAKWNYVGGRYYLQVFLDASYEGEAAIVNEAYYFAGNTLRIDEDLLLPSGEKTGASFLLHVYRTNSITEIIDEELREEAVYVENVSAGYDVNGDFNIWITFSEEISAGMRLFLASPDSFGKTQLKPMNNHSIVYYDDELAKNFISGGYKSALLDNVLVNGVSIGEWLACDKTPGYLTAVMVHYGQVTQKTVSIVCDLADDHSWATDIFTAATESYKNGGLSVTVKEGMRFPTGKRVNTDAEYLYVNGKWQKKVNEFGVYFAGNKVENGETVETKVKATVGDVFVSGNDSYTVREERQENVVTFKVYANEVETFVFSVRENIVAAPEAEQGMGCAATMQGLTAAYALALTVGTMVWIGIRRKKNA